MSIKEIVCVWFQASAHLNIRKSKKENQILEHIQKEKRKRQLHLNSTSSIITKHEHILQNTGLWALIRQGTPQRELEFEMKHHKEMCCQAKN